MYCCGGVVGTRWVRGGRAVYFEWAGFGVFQQHFTCGENLLTNKKVGTMHQWERFQRGTGSLSPFSPISLISRILQM